MLLKIIETIQGLLLALVEEGHLNPMARNEFWFRGGSGVAGTGLLRTSIAI